MSLKKITPITDLQIKNAGVVSLAIRPNQSAQYGEGNLTGKELQQRFDSLAKLAISRCNVLVQLLSGGYKPSSNSDEESILDYILTIKAEESSLGEDLSLSDVLSKILTTDGEIKAIDPTATNENTFAELNSVISKLYEIISDNSENIDSITQNTETEFESIENEFDSIKNTVNENKNSLQQQIDGCQERVDAIETNVGTISSDLDKFKSSVNTLLDSDDTALDQTKEIVAYIKSNRDLIDAITTAKVSVADIVNNLDSDSENKPLSAKQGKSLKEMIDKVQAGEIVGINIKGGKGEDSIEQENATAVGKNSSAFGVSEVTSDNGNLKTEVRVVRGYDPDIDDVIITRYGSGGAGSGSTGDLTETEQPDANSVMTYRDDTRIYSTFSIDFDSTGAVGENSFASGEHTLAAAKNSTATGWKTYAGANYSSSEGSYSIAVGEDSHAEGLKNASMGQATHTEGMRNTAEGKNSHVEGLKNHTTTNAVNSHVEGSYNNCRSSNTHIEGMWNYSVGSASHSHVEGTENNTNAPDSHVEGSYNSISGSYKATVDGAQKTFYSQNAHVEGSENTAETSSATQTAKNAHVEGHGNKVSAENAHAEGESNIVSGKNSHAEGYNTRAIGKHSHAEGSNVNADGSVRKTRTVTLSDGSSFSVEGSTAQGMSSHAEGVQSIAYGFTSHAEGYRTLAEGDVTHAEGSETQAIGAYAHAEGRLSKATGERSHAEGTSTIASGYSSHAGGESTIAARKSQHVIGQFNIEDTYSDKSNSVPSKCKGKYLHIVGNGTSTARSNAHTIDWSGNAWFSGDVRVGGTGYDNGSTLATEKQVKALSQAPVRVDVNITIVTQDIYAQTYEKMRRVAFSYYSKHDADNRSTMSGLWDDIFYSYGERFLIPAIVYVSEDKEHLSNSVYAGSVHVINSEKPIFWLCYDEHSFEKITIVKDVIVRDNDEVDSVERTDINIASLVPVHQDLMIQGHNGIYHDYTINAVSHRLSDYTGSPF